MRARSGRRGMREGSACTACCDLSPSMGSAHSNLLVTACVARVSSMQQQRVAAGLVEIQAARKRVATLKEYYVDTIRGQWLWMPMQGEPAPAPRIARN